MRANKPYLYVISIKVPTKDGKDPTSPSIYWENKSTFGPRQGPVFLFWPFLQGADPPSSKGGLLVFNYG